MTKEDVIKEFSSINGVGKAKADLIYNSGFDSIEKLGKASVEDLVKIKGINVKFAKDIKDQLKKKEGSTSEKKSEKLRSKTEKKVEKKVKSETKTKEEKPKITQKEDKDIEIIEEEEEGAYRVKRKPELSEELKEKLLIRKQIKNRTPDFIREEWFRYKRISRNWRRPDGITSKMRINLKYRPNKVRIGYRGPKETRGLHSSGFEEIAVYNVKDIENVDPKTQAARIGSTVGTKKRIEIEKKAEELDVRVLNRS